MNLNKVGLLIILLNLLLSCKNEADYFSPRIVDYPHLGTVNTTFRNVDSLIYSNDYMKAIEAYMELLSRSLATEDRLYAWNQLSRCYLARMVRRFKRLLLLCLRCIGKIPWSL